MRVGTQLRFLYAILLVLAVSILVYARTTPYVGMEALENLHHKQGLSICATVGIILALYAHFQKDLKELLRLGRFRAPFYSIPQLGIRRSKHNTWMHFGSRLALLVALLMFMNFHAPQIARGLNLEAYMNSLSMSIGLSCIEAFTSIIIVGLGIVILSKGTLQKNQICVLGAIVFGLLGYWSVIGGLHGSIVSATVGWTIMKSIIESKGIFWGWLIHTAQSTFSISALLII